MCTQWHPTRSVCVHKVIVLFVRGQTVYYLLCDKMACLHDTVAVHTAKYGNEFYSPEYPVTILWTFIENVIAFLHQKIHTCHESLNVLCGAVQFLGYFTGLLVFKTKNKKQKKKNALLVSTPIWFTRTTYLSPHVHVSSWTFSSHLEFIIH